MILLGAPSTVGGVPRTVQVVVCGPHGCSSRLEGLRKAVHRCVFSVVGVLLGGEGSATVLSWTTDAILSWKRRVVCSSGRLSCNCLCFAVASASCLSQRLHFYVSVFGIISMLETLVQANIYVLEGFHVP